MKLKKVMALALAGVMAVSMLTGCGNGGNGGASENGEENGVAGGFSSVLAKYMEESAKMDNVSFQDDADVTAALADALGNRGSLLLAGNTVAPVVLPEVSPLVGSDFKSNLGLDAVVTDVINVAAGDYEEILALFCKDSAANTTRSVGLLFVVDGTVSVEKALKQVADGMSAYVEDEDEGEDEGFPTDMISLDYLVSQLPDSRTTGGKNEDGETIEAGETWEYNYTVSASVVNKALTVFEGYNGSANFIAVTITRTLK